MNTRSGVAFKEALRFTLTVPLNLPSVTSRAAATVAAAAQRWIVIDKPERPARHARGCGKAAELAGQPEADATLIGERKSLRISKGKSRERCGCDTAQDA